MEEQAAIVISNQEGITARVCPHGQIHLQIGYTNLTLPQDTFLDLAQIVRAVETHIAVSLAPRQREHTH